jgi:formate hydrogenlyase subunit 3/multisubunit Na+/H+ antiporter MnhD subunit
MYDNDYSISLLGVAGWLAVAALGGSAIAFIRTPKLRRRIAIWWSLVPAVAITALCVILYIVLPEDRYLSPDGHWLVMLLVAAFLSLALTSLWAFIVWLSVKTVRHFRDKRCQDANGS